MSFLYSARWTATMLAVAVATSFALVAAPPVLVVVTVAAVLLTITIIRRPEFGALLMLILFEIFPRSTLFDRGLPFAGGRLKVTDLLLVVTLGSWLAGRARRPSAYRLPSRSTVLLLLGFLTFAFASLVTAHNQGAPLKLGLLELRPLLAYLLVFPFVSGLRNAQRLEHSLAVVLAASVIVSLTEVWKYLHGEGAVASFSGGALRVQNTVFVYPLVAVLWSTVVLGFVRSPQLRAAVLALSAVSLAGLFFTFQRGAWLAALVGLPVVVVLMPGHRRARLLRWSLPLIAGAAVLVMALNTLSTRGVGNPLASGLHRLESLGDYQNDVSNRYRLAEWSRAGHVIRQHPLTGIGLGNSITFENPMYSPDYNTSGFVFSTYYIHDSYIWYTLKLGIIGAFVFFALLGKVLVSAFRRCRGIKDAWARTILLGSLGALTSILVLGISGPHLNDPNATPAIAALIALVEVAPRLAANRHAGEPV